MTRDVITCGYWGGEIGPHWQVFQPVACKSPGVGVSPLVARGVRFPR
jgi:hypothetical protein